MFALIKEIITYIFDSVIFINKISITLFSEPTIVILLPEILFLIQSSLLKNYKIIIY